MTRNCLPFSRQRTLNRVMAKKATSTTPAKSMRVSAVASGPMSGERYPMKMNELPQIAESVRRIPISIAAMEGKVVEV